MVRIIKDPLLTCARVIINIVMVVVIIAAVALVVGAGYLAIDPSDLTVELSRQGLAHPDHAVVTAIISIMLLALIPVGLALWFLHLLKLIIDSVGIGDPFVPANAARLAHMGWLVIGMQAAFVPIGLIAVWLAQRVKDVHVDVGVSAQGVVMALVLFILARVFRQGAAMREELEGTV